MPTNPFKKVSDALGPPKKKPAPKPAPKAAPKASGTSRQAGIDAAERRRAAAKNPYTRSSTDKGKKGR